MDYQADHVWTVRRATGPVRPQVRYTLEPAGGRATNLKVRFDIPVLAGPAVLLRPAVAPLRPLVERLARKDLERLREVLESSAVD